MFPYGGEYNVFYSENRIYARKWISSFVLDETMVQIDSNEAC
jgi:hypothetical protein